MAKRVKSRTRVDRRIIGVAIVVLAGCAIAYIEGIDAIGIARALALITASIGVLYGVRLLRQ